MGKAAYGRNDEVQLDGKQAGKSLLFYPYTLLDDVVALKWPTKMIFQEKAIEIPASAILNLGPLERPLFALEQSMFVNYFERERIGIETQFGTNTDAWPSDWILRGSCGIPSLTRMRYFLTILPPRLCRGAA